MSQLEDCYKEILKYNINYKSFPDLVRAFWEFSDENDLLYDYSGNGFELTNFGCKFSKYGVYFPTTEDIRYLNQYEEDLRRIYLKSDKLNELLQPINDEFSISFDFIPIESKESIIFDLRNDTANTNTNIIRVSLTSDGKLNVYIVKNNTTIYTVNTASAVSLNKPHHFCLISGNGQTKSYLDNVQIGSTADNTIDINDNSYYTYYSMTIGCSKQLNGDKYSYPYAGYFSNLLIVSEALSDELRTSIYNKDYSYDILIYAGQSNMVGVGVSQLNVDTDYSEISGIVYQYDYNTDSIIAATNPLKHYSDLPGTMGGWLEMIKRYVKYYKRSKNRKVLIIPCAKVGTTFASNWGPGKDMMNHLIENCNICTSLSKMNKIIGMLWYQGEGEVGTSNANYPQDLETFRQGLITNINGFTQNTPIVFTLINNKNVISTTIMGTSANTFVNNTMMLFCKKYNYGYIITGDLQLKSDFTHLTAESLREVGKRWYNEFCRITSQDNRDIPIIQAYDKVQFKETNIEKLDVKKLNIIHDNNYDVDIETYIPMMVNVDVTTPINIRVNKAIYQPKTDDIWLLPNAVSEKTIKYYNVKTKKLVEMNNWPSLLFSGYCCCLYKDFLYVLDNNHNDSSDNGDILADNVLYIIDTLNYTIETVKNFVTKTSGIGTTWVPPEESSDNVTQNVMSAITYCALFPYDDKIYFIPMAQQEIAIYDIATKTLDQTTLDLGVNIMGMYGATYNPSNKCLYMSRAYKIGSAGWDIPYLNFNNSPPIINYIELPSNYVAYRYGCYCFSNNCVYIPTSTHDNGANAILLKIAPDHTITGLTLSDWTQNKQFNSILYSPNDRILLSRGGVVHIIKPALVGANDESLETSINLNGSRFLQCFDKYGVLYSFNNTSETTFGTTRIPITINNKEIFNPIFNSLH